MGWLRISTAVLGVSSVLHGVELYNHCTKVSCPGSAFGLDLSRMTAIGETEARKHQITSSLHLQIHRYHHFKINVETLYQSVTTSKLLLKYELVKSDKIDYCKRRTIILTLLYQKRQLRTLRRQKKKSWFCFHLFSCFPLLLLSLFFLFSLSFSCFSSLYLSLLSKITV